MDDRLITDTALVLLSLGGVSYFYARFRLAKRTARKATRARDSALEEAERERQCRCAAEERLEAVHEHVGTMLQGTPYKAPSRMWRLKAFGWLAGLATGAWAAARSHGYTTVAAGAAVVVVAGGYIGHAVWTVPDTDPHSPPAAVAPHPPTAPRQQALPAPSPASTTALLAPETATGTTALAPTTTGTPPVTTSAPRTTAGAAPSTTTPTTVAAQSDAAPTVTVTTSAPAEAAHNPPVQGLPEPPVDNKTWVRPVPDNAETRSAGSTAKGARPAQVNSATCITTEPLLPITLCLG